jgi:hypothetical protein
MDFRTEVKIPSTDLRVSYRSGTLLMGSCFTENIGNRMEDLLFPADTNPFGIIYNPSSLFRNLWALLDVRNYKKEDLHSHNDLWFSYDHHGEFSSPDPDNCLNNINKRIKTSHENLKTTGTLILTWGTAWVFVSRITKNVVSNCHKVPAEKFQRHLLSVTQIVDTYSKLFAKIRKDFPDLKILLTVSPVRHLKDGAEMNTISKSTLILAAHELTGNFSYCDYFPAYEIAMDDLRDYRYYKSDMVHPNKQMGNYIWEKFSGAYFDAETRQISRNIQKFFSAANHKPFHPHSKQYLDFCKKQIKSIQILQVKYPFLSLEGLIESFKSRL